MIYIITVVLLLLDTEWVLGFKNGMFIDILSLPATLPDLSVPKERYTFAQQKDRISIASHQAKTRIS